MRFAGMKLNGHNPTIKMPIHIPVVNRIVAFLPCTGGFQDYFDASDCNKYAPYELFRMGCGCENR